MHIRSGYPLYNAESRQRMYYYPPPYWYSSYWAYVTPWLWYDGDKHGSHVYATWESKIVARMAQPAPVTIAMWGHYDTAEDTGRVYTQFRNDSSATINGRVIVVVTEDSIYSPSPNGDQWHNHVARDYIPTHNGQVVSIPAGDSVVLDQPLSFDPSWQRYMCEIKTWIQDDSMQVDTTKEIWQGGILKVTDLTFIEEETSNDVVLSDVTVSPNPCISSTAFAFNISAGSAYTITLYDIAGRVVRTLHGNAITGSETVQWNLCDNSGDVVSSGVYFYDFTTEDLHSSGKVVVR